MENKKPVAKAAALLPILVFLVLYLGLGLIFEYALKIPMGFYNIPIVVAFLVAILVACLQNRSVKFNDKLVLMAKGVGDPNIMTMILIFMAAGIFVGVTGRSSAEAAAYFLLSVAPAKLAVAVLFVVACFISMAMGTSVGTITLIAPIAVAVAADSGFSLPLCIASVVGGAMFGDNLSFISDTTIAACSTQGCEMKDKFRANFKIALPAALAALVIILLISIGTDVSAIPEGGHDLVLLIPYVLVLIGGIVGLNVFVVLLIGIVSGALITLVTGQVTALELLGNMGGGVSGMFETVMVTILVSALCGMIRAYGGFESLLQFIRRCFKGNRGGQLGVGLLVGVMDIATANNTVAIVMAGPIAKEISEEYGIEPKRAASLLDTFSCIFQGIIPYGAQMLVAISACATLGYTVSAFEIIPLLFYPFLLAVSSVLFIIFTKKSK
ncbi:MAG: Na+/H+ antiporter NhaC family protein [Oscillospiraceae bacterium]|nr:Na+/H+ antiporter NhaC family protein [Oscillospiraceae bacterium]